MHAHLVVDNTTSTYVYRTTHACMASKGGVQGDLIALYFKFFESPKSLFEVLGLSAIVLEGLWALHVWAPLFLSL